METKNAVAVIGISGAHLGIRDTFVRRVMSLLQESALSLKGYNIQENTYENRESVELEIGDGTKLTIYLITRP